MGKGLYGKRLYKIVGLLRFYIEVYPKTRKEISS